MSLRIISFGEALIDIYETGDSTDTVEMDAFSGGAPMNFICACSKFGADTCTFYTNITDSSLSIKLKNILKKYKIKIRTQRKPEEPPATIVMDDGDFKFFITPDSFKFSRWTFKRRDFRKADLLHFGSMFLFTKEGFRATKRAIKLSKKKNVKISFDLNYRPVILKQLNIKEKVFRKRILKLIKDVDFVKFNEDEAELIFGSTRTKKLFKTVSNRKNRDKVFVMTRGKKGADVFYRAQVYSHAAYKAKNVVDSTGAGDIFHAAFLTKLLTTQKYNYDMDNIKTAMEYGNKMASKSLAYKGAITALDKIDEDDEE